MTDAALAPDHLGSGLWDADGNLLGLVVSPGPVGSLGLAIAADELFDAMLTLRATPAEASPSS